LILIVYTVKLLGLFAKAITQSGSAIKPWSFMEKPRDQARILGTKLKCPTEDSVKLVTCLKGLDANLIIATHWDYLVRIYFKKLNKIFHS